MWLLSFWRSVSAHAPGGHDPAKVRSDTWQPYTPAARLANLTLLDTKFKVGCNMEARTTDG